MGVIAINKDNFNEEVLNASQTVLVDFYAVWCGPCQMMHPVMENIASQRTDVKVCKVDVDQNMELARKYQVVSIPTFLVFKNGEVVNRTLGAHSQGEIEALL